MNPVVISANKEQVEEALSKIENIWLSKSDPDSLEGADEAVENGKKTKNCYISGRGSATIADLLAYCEVKVSTDTSKYRD